MYNSNGNVAIVNSYFSNNNADMNGNDIYTTPTIILINTTLNSSPDTISGSPQKCVQDICRDTISSYPKFGIDCKNELNKNGNYGMQCFPCHPGTYLGENDQYPSCLNCLAGKATNKYGSASCDACSPGKVRQ